MKVPRLHVGTRLSGSSTLDLPANPAHHAGTVLRLRPGQEVELFDGNGGSHRAVVEVVTRGRLSVKLLAFNEQDAESPLQVTLVQGISRGPHMDFTVQKATELGVRRILPVFTAFGNVKLDASRAESRHQHWLNVAIAACEQCGRNRLPEIAAPVPLQDCLGGPLPALRLLFEGGAGRSLRELEAGAVTEVALLVGPEGGLAEHEVRTAIDAGFIALQLGPRVLRTETAAAAAITACQVLWGDL